VEMCRDRLAQDGIRLTIPQMIPAGERTE